MIDDDLFCIFTTFFEKCVHDMGYKGVMIFMTRAGNTDLIFWIVQVKLSFFHLVVFCMLYILLSFEVYRHMTKAQRTFFVVI